MPEEFEEDEEEEEDGEAEEGEDEETGQGRLTVTSGVTSRFSGLTLGLVCAMLQLPLTTPGADASRELLHCTNSFLIAQFGRI